MAQFRFVFLLASASLLVNLSFGEDEAFAEYNAGVVLKALGEAIRNTFQFHTQGGFSLEKVVSYHCRTP